MTGDLAQRRPFSDSAYILEQMRRKDRLRAELVASAAGVEKLESDGFDRLQEDALVRTMMLVFESSLHRTGTLNETETRVASALFEGCVGNNSPLSLQASLDSIEVGHSAANRHRILLWQPPGESSGILMQPFSEVLDSAYRGTPRNPQHVASFTGEQRLVIDRALDLLFGVMPDVAAGMLLHVQVLCRVESTGSQNILLSGSRTEIPGVVFLGDSVLTSPIKAAEHILHEACHQRYRTLMQSMSLLAPYYRDEFGSKISVPWHRPSETVHVWSIDKALTAAHVYLHLAYMYGMLHDTQAFGFSNDEMLASALSKLERCRYLLNAITASGRVQLGYAGNLLLDWMTDIAAMFVIDDLPNARLTRLLFERYLEEEAELDAARAAFEPEMLQASRRSTAFLTWLATLEPEASQRFERCIHASEAYLAEPTGGNPLERYVAARHKRAERISTLLGLLPGQLDACTNHRGVLAFAQTESSNLFNFLDPAFRDQLSLSWLAHDRLPIQSAT